MPNDQSTSWGTSPRRRSLACNGELIRYYRDQKKWTQKDLAERAGYTVRLIRKAESGQPIHADTIEDLAVTFVEHGIDTTPEDLVSDPFDVARRFCELLATHEHQAASHSCKLLHDEVVLTVAGDPDEFNFAGRFISIDGFDQFLTRFYRVLFRPDKGLWKPKVVAHGNEAISWGLERMQMYGVDETVSSILVLRFKFHRGKIIEIEDDYDTEASAAYFRKHAPSIDTIQLASPNDLP